MTVRVRTAAAAICLALGVEPVCARAQAEPVLRMVGHPERVAAEQAVMDVRTFAVARAGDRVLIVYVQANDPNGRGSLRSALLHETADHALQREGPDRTLAPGALALAVSWDGHGGAVAYTIPRPHRGEPTGARRPRTGGRERALADPLGSSALTAADVMFQRIDENGAPLGRAVLAFEENSRAFHVAIGRDGDNWQLAWTGGMSVDGEIQGTVRTIRVNAQGVPRSFASETGFAGQVGDVLRVIPPGGARHDAMVLFTGERCLAHEHEPPRREPAGDPSANVDTHPRALQVQQPLQEHVGPPIACDGWQMFTALLHADGSTAPIVAGPSLSSDALSVIAAGDPLRVVAPLEHALTAFDLDSDGHSAHAIRLGETTASTNDAGGVFRNAAALDAAATRDGITAVAVSTSRQRIAFGVFDAAGVPATLMLAAPAPSSFELAVAAGENGAPWVFAQTGTVVGGPLIFLRGDASALHAAAPETTWSGDERFTQLVLRVRAARAAFTALETVYGPLAERPDATTNARLPGMIAAMHRLRGPWDSACESLQERARFLARHGADADITQFAATLCELPPEPLAPGAPITPPP